MHRTRILRAIGVSLLSAVVSGSQSAPAALSEALRAHVKNERFDIVTSIRGLPLGVRSGLQTLFSSQEPDIALDIADPGAKFQVADVIATPRLPVRRLVAAGCSTDHCLVHYERGASPTRGTWRCFTGRRLRLDSSGAVTRPADWRQSTTFGTPS